jgi:tyrosyl-tRNA synthetase
MAFVASADLRFAGFSNPEVWDPARLLQGELLERAQALPVEQQWALIEDLDPDMLTAALREAPHTEITRPAEGGEWPLLVDLMAATELVASRSAARRTVAESGASLNNVKVVDADQRLSSADLLPGGCAVLRRGKRSVAGVFVL